MTAAILEELDRQHRDAEAMLRRLDATVRRARSEGTNGPGVLVELAALRHEIQGEVLSHFREEEQALFPVLGRHVGSSDGPIAAMMEEHALFRQLELQFEEALAALEAGHRDTWLDNLVDAAEGIARLMPPHIEKEDTVIFPMAEQMLSDDEWSEVGRLWSKALAASHSAG